MQALMRAGRLFFHRHRVKHRVFTAVQTTRRSARRLKPARARPRRGPARRPRCWMDDDEIDDWLDSSDDEAGEAADATPRPSTPSFLAETTPDTARRRARRSGRTATTRGGRRRGGARGRRRGDQGGSIGCTTRAPEWPDALGRVGRAARARGRDRGRTKLAGRRGDDRRLSLAGAPKAADLPEPEPEVGATDADSPAADAYISLEDAFSHLGARERVPAPPKIEKIGSRGAESAEAALSSRTSYPAPVFAKTRTTRTTLTTRTTRNDRNAVRRR